MRDLFIEIYESIRRNKLRTCLTGFAVSWGIFMLIVLLGAGNGLINAFIKGSDDLSTNVMTVYGGWTTKPYAGYKSGRRIRIEEADVALTKSAAFRDHIDQVAPYVSAGVTATLGDKYLSTSVEGNYPERQVMDKVTILHGRFINSNDIKHSRKVVVIPQRSAERLMPDPSKYAAILGQNIKIDGLSFKVIGISKNRENSTSTKFFAPYTTVKTIWAKGRDLDFFSFSFHDLNTEQTNEAFEKDYKAALQLRHSAAPDDESATYISNTFTQNIQINTASRAIRISLWVIGILTLLSGIVGVSNIMLITVKERTHEFGIRKAIGARPWSITKLIVSESVVVTTIFGYIGMTIGMIACEILDKTVGSSTMSVLGAEVAIFRNPTVGMDVAIEATALLIIAGTIAGLIPALKAAKVRPIEALRAE